MNNLLCTYVYWENCLLINKFIYYPFNNNIIRKDVLLFPLLKKVLKPRVLNMHKFKTGNVFISKI